MARSKFPAIVPIVFGLFAAVLAILVFSGPVRQEIFTLDDKQITLLMNGAGIKAESTVEIAHDEALLPCTPTWLMVFHTDNELSMTQECETEGGQTLTDQARGLWRQTGDRLCVSAGALTGREHCWTMFHGLGGFEFRGRDGEVDWRLSIVRHPGFGSHESLLEAVLAAGGPDLSY